MSPSHPRFAVVLTVMITIAGTSLPAQAPPQSGAEIAALRKEIEELKSTLQLILKHVQQPVPPLQPRPDLVLPPALATAAARRARAC